MKEGKKHTREDREKKVLLGLVSYYIKTGKPVGSETLRSQEFQKLSPATIRNYFVRLEKEGYLLQQHVSGGRVPTDKAYRLYAEEVIKDVKQSKSKGKITFPLFESEEHGEPKELIGYLQRTCESLSDLGHVAAFVSSPRFDQDFVVDIRLVGFDPGRVIAVLLTNFGLVHTEVLYSSTKLTAHSLKRIESYCRFRLAHSGATSDIFPEELDRDELEIAHRFYQEAVARYLVRYSHFVEEDVFRAGFSKLLRYPEFQDAKALTSSLSIFENKLALHGLIREVLKMKEKKLHYWIGSDLFTYLSTEQNCAVVAASYAINQKPVGVIGVIGPARMPYKELFEMLTEASEKISTSLTNTLYKYRITYRTPDAEAIDKYSKGPLLLEDQR